MERLIKINSDNNLQTIEFLSRLSELTKCTLGGLNSTFDQSEFISLNNFSFRFSSFLPKEISKINNLPYDDIFIGKNSEKLISVYRQLLDVFIQLEEFRIPPTNQPLIGYQRVKEKLRKVDEEIDQIIQLYS